MIKYLIYFILVFLISGSSYSQQIQWVRTYGSSGSDNAYCIKEDGLGNVYVSGIFNSNNNNAYVSTIKYNLNGDSIWARSYIDTNGNSPGRNILLDDSMNVYISGRFIIKYSSGGNFIYEKYFGCTTDKECFDNSKKIVYAGYEQQHVLNYDNYLKLVLLKTDQNGDTLWKKIYPQFPSIFDITGIAVDKSNNIIVSAYSEIGSADNDLIVKFDPYGNVLWSKIFEGAYRPEAGIVLDSLDNIIFCDNKRDQNGNWNKWTVKYDPAGNVIWELMDPGFGKTLDLKIDAHGYIYKCGLYANSIITTVKYNSAGQLIWSQSVPNSYNYSFGKLAIDSSGNVFLASTYKFVGFPTGYQSFRGIKYSVNGTQLWSVVYPDQGVYDYFATDICVDRHGNTFITGNGAAPTYGNYYTIRINSLTGLIHNSNELPTNFSVSQNYPNPFNPTTVIRYSIPEGTGREMSVQLKVYDANGKEIETLVNQRQNAGSYSVSFNASNYPSGVYFYKLKAGEFSETKKMVIIK